MRLLFVLIALLSTTLTTTSFSKQINLRDAHRLKHEERYEEAIEMFQAIIDANGDDAFFARNAIKDAQRLLAYRENLSKYFQGCESRRDCVSEHFLFDGKPIHPLIIKAFLGYSSDFGPAITGINLNVAQGSNQFCCDTSYDWTILEDGKFLVRTDFANDFSTAKRPKEDCEVFTCWMEYVFHGTNSDGYLVVEVWVQNGGSVVEHRFIYMELTYEMVSRRTDHVMTVLNSRRFASSFD